MAISFDGGYCHGYISIFFKPWHPAGVGYQRKPFNDTWVLNLDNQWGSSESSCCIPSWMGSDTSFIFIWLVVWLPFFIFPYIGNNHPNWLIFFRGVESTNQLFAMENNYNQQRRLVQFFVWTSTDWPWHGVFVEWSWEVWECFSDRGSLAN